MRAVASTSRSSSGAARAPFSRTCAAARYLDWVLSGSRSSSDTRIPRRSRPSLDVAARRYDASARRPSREVELAAEIVAAVPPSRWSARVLGHPGGHGAQIRLARAGRAETGAPKFAGCYHGHVDAPARGVRLRTSRRSGIPATPGVPYAATADTIVVPFNDPEGVAAAVMRFGEGTGRTSSSSPSPGTWASCRRGPASSRRCGGSATRAARCSSSTR